MLLTRGPLRTISRGLQQTVRSLSEKSGNSNEQNPRIVRIFEDKPPARDNAQLRKKFSTTSKNDDNNIPSHFDVVIVGGGAVGSSIAYNLTKRAGPGLKVAVLEKDKTYEKASTPRSNGGVRQQFSLEENISISLYAAEFLKNAKQHLGDDVNVNFLPYGYLFLVTEQRAEELHQNSKMQNELGAKNVILTPDKLKEKFPWLNTQDVALGCYGLEKEGWFDPWGLLMGFKRQAISAGTKYIDGEAVKFDFKKIDHIHAPGASPGEYEAPNQVQVKLNTGEEKSISFDKCVLAAGAWSGEVAKLLRIGTGSGLLSTPLPVEPRKRYVYAVKCQGENQPPYSSPSTICPTSNAYFRCDGLDGRFIVGRSPSRDVEPATDNLDVDYDFFDEYVWPYIAHRVPAFENIKLQSAWGGYYDFNTFDENAIVGRHPYYHNVYVAAGFSGHGIHQSPAVGNAMSELILDGKFTDIDLKRFGFDRLVSKEPMIDRYIV